MVRAPRRIADYDASFDPVRRSRIEKSGRQAGDPAKAAQAVLQLIDAPEPPAHLLLGSDALALVSAALTQRLAQVDEWEVVTCSTDA